MGGPGGGRQVRAAEGQGGALARRNVVLGVSGGIAAYKAIEVCRRLVDAGAHVSPVMTQGALRFVGAATFSALASEPVRTSLWDSPEPIPHTRLGQQADLVIVAPATARVLGAYAAGISSDLLTATLLATRAPVIVCPAMHTEMWEHPAVQDNLTTLRRRGVHVVEPAVGRLAGGDQGPGRLADPVDIVAAADAVLAGGRPLIGMRAVVTAGGTREPIDPVRFLGNRSSGKQGYAIAGELARRGAQVTLITTADLATPGGVDPVAVETAAEMERAVTAASDDADIVVMAAAVADFRPRSVAGVKLKKTEGVPAVGLEHTPDILAGLGQRKKPGQVLVGFAAETGTDLVDAARSKLAAKGADIIVANDVSSAGAGFSHDTNAVTIVDATDGVHQVPLASKGVVAVAIADAIMSRLDSSPRGDPFSPTPTHSEERS